MNRDGENIFLGRKGPRLKCLYLLDGSVWREYRVRVKVRNSPLGAEYELL